jgi:hypothetical protein
MCLRIMELTLPLFMGEGLVPLEITKNPSLNNRTQRGPRAIRVVVRDLVILLAMNLSRLKSHVRDAKSK